MRKFFRTQLIISAILCAIYPSIGWAESATLSSDGLKARSSDWAETLGARMRVHFEPINEKASWRAVLDVELEEGWNSYWLDPGYNGIPPQVTIKDRSDSVVDHTLIFQAPEKLGNDDQSYAGYLDRFSLGIMPVDPDTLPEKFDVFIGLCSTICVPFQTSLELKPPASVSAEKLSGYYAQKAFSNMPDDLGVIVAPITSETLTVTFPVALSPSYQLILSELKGWKFSDITQSQDDPNIVRFSAKLLKQGDAPSPTAFSLVSSDKAHQYAGTIVFKIE